MSEKFSVSVAYEIKRARTKHPKPESSRHGGFGVLMEEFEEVKEAVFHDMTHSTLRAELVQLAAACQRMAEDLGL